MNRRVRTPSLGLSLMMTITLAGCMTSGGPPPAADGEGLADRPYVIGIPDVLRVTVWKYPDLSAEAPVRSDGKISVPLVEDVQAAGLTPEALADVIAKELSQYVSRPDVTIIVVSADSQMVTVMGGVQQSGPVPIRAQTSVAEAIGAAGGFTPWANKRDVRVIRVVDGERVTYRFNYHDYLNGKEGSDILLEPGDVIAVSE
jgi:polysaccharide export outer membrane protein